MPYPCSDPGVNVELLGELDPAIGTFEGTISWLQTGEDTVLTLVVTEPETETLLQCDIAKTKVELSTSTEDGLLVEAWSAQSDVSEAGNLTVSEFSIAIEPLLLVQAGKVPEAPDILTRNPAAILTLNRRNGGIYDAQLTLRSATDSLYIAQGRVHKVEL